MNEQERHTETAAASGTSATAEGAGSKDRGGRIEEGGNAADRERRAAESETEGLGVGAVEFDPRAPATAEDVFDALFPVEKSIRYHQRRRASYDARHRWLMLFIILLGSASVADLAHGLSAVLGLLTALFGAIDLVFGLSDKARDHEFLLKRFCNLMAKIKRCSSPTQQDVINWRVDRQEIEADEPAVYWALEAACYNEATHALGRDRDDGVVLHRFHRLMKNLMQFDPTQFKTVAQIREEQAAAKKHFWRWRSNQQSPT